jgi:Bacteriophage T4-like portal protein (Gp20)
MAEQNYTVFQKLTKMFGYPGKTRPDQTPSFSFSKDELLKTDNREEYEKALLQAQQSQYIADKWAKLDQSLYNQSVYYEPNRLAAYYDYESMEFTPEISAALDIYAEESTTMSEKGEILTIFSESTRVKNILDDLFKNVLDVNTNLQMWTRGLCKYGDNFVYLKIDPEKGIIGCQQLPNIEIERLEGASSKIAGQNRDVKMPSRELRFHWKNKDMEFQAWEVAHFRILGDDRKLPYGTSMLDKIRRIWKQLLLAEDAMLIYRTSRAPERRIFKIFVGNMDDKDIEAYVQRVASKFKRDQISDPRNGQVDMRYNQMSVDQDYFIPVRDPAAPSPIDTLPGAQNLGEIADIEYIQKKLLAALRIPKAFLGFEEVVGEGKSLALMDIRFARTINRIQKSVIQELNKIALVHLYLLGLEDELNNFTLGLTNPSAQSDLLRIEQWKEKVTLYKDATSDQSQLGILPVSHTWAKKNILGFSDAEVLLDLQQQRLERAVGFELMNTSQLIIKRSGIFDNVDAKYGIPEEEREKVEAAAGGGAEGAEGGMGGMDMGGGAPAEAPTAGGEPLSESTSRKSKILGMLGEEKEDFNILFDMNKAQQNIYEIETKITDILND